MEINSKFMISEQDPIGLRKWHGTANHFTSTVTHFYEDNTIAKAVLLKDKLDLSIKQLHVKRNLLHLQTDVRNNAQVKRKMQEKWDEILQSQLSEHRKIESRATIAAITIQRYVRGFLARINTEQDFINLIDTKLEKLIHDSSVQALNIMLNLGAILVPATILIQGAYKRYLGRSKIYRWGLCYKQYLNDKIDRACNIVQKGIRMFMNRHNIKALNFLKIRERKLHAIKERLAILKIKEFWKSKRLTFKIIKERIQRIKRRQAAMQNKEAYAKYLNSLGGKLERKQTMKFSTNSEDERKSEIESPGLQDPAAELLDEEDYLESLRMKELIQKRIQDKINKGKVAHAITAAKQVMVLPLMQEKALKESPSEEGKLLNLTVSVFAKGRSLSRDQKGPSRATLIGSPPSYEHKRLYQIPQLTHMRAL